MQPAGMITVSHTDAFLAERSIRNVKRKAAQHRINIRFEEASHQIQERSDSQNKSYFGGFFTGWNPKQDKFFNDHGEVIDLDVVPLCVQCGELFSFLGRKTQCPTCRRIVCDKCLTHEYALPLKPPLKGTLDVCKRCYVLVLKEESKKEFEKLVEESNKSRFMVWYNTLYALKHEIEKQMPAFRGIVYTLTQSTTDIVETIESLGPENLSLLKQQSGAQQKGLEIHFKNLESRLKMILATETKSTREEQVKKVLRLSTVDFLQKTLPEFKLLAEDLKKFMSDPIICNTISAFELMKKKEQEKDNRRIQSEPKAPVTPKTPKNTPNTSQPTAKVVKKEDTKSQNSQNSNSQRSQNSQKSQKAHSTPNVHMPQKMNTQPELSKPKPQTKIQIKQPPVDPTKPFKSQPSQQQKQEARGRENTRQTAITTATATATSTATATAATTTKTIVQPRVQETESVPTKNTQPPVTSEKTPSRRFSRSPSSDSYHRRYSSRSYSDDYSPYRSYSRSRSFSRSPVRSYSDSLSPYSRSLSPRSRSGSPYRSYSPYHSPSRSPYHSPYHSPYRSPYRSRSGSLHRSPYRSRSSDGMGSRYSYDSDESPITRERRSSYLSDDEDVIQKRKLSDSSRARTFSGGKEDVVQKRKISDSSRGRSFSGGTKEEVKKREGNDLGGLERDIDNLVSELSTAGNALLTNMLNGKEDKDKKSSWLNRILRRNDDNHEQDKFSGPPPVITSVRPAVVPITGGVEIDIQGENFQAGLEVVIGGKKIPSSKCIVTQTADSSHVFVVIPPNRSEGPKDIIIINGDKQTAILSDVLMYLDDPEIASEFKQKEEKAHHI
eukprot:TRINITY_DN5242_c0_g2_i1.p1 TRINITY_DN5242_c0_g2~~TRINITY_DN5242_c0_g2_i1.p1  ORF type:complete len:847 (-),score=148.50 TRINITY_DN5242_c0_g2_i1:75-2573(-)